MEKIFNNLVNEFGNYLLTIQNENKEREFLIYGSVINHPNKQNLINLFRVKNENENNETKTITLQDGTEKTIQCCCQVNEWIYVFNLKNNEETKNKLKDYLNQLLTYKN